MTQQHPITTPPELLQRLCAQADATWRDRLELAYQAGADAELEACVKEVSKPDSFTAAAHLRATKLADQLRAARRPNPPSLKEQALEDLEILVADLANHGMGFKATNIRRALEQLDD